MPIQGWVVDDVPERLARSRDSLERGIVAVLEDRGEELARQTEQDHVVLDVLPCDLVAMLDRCWRAHDAGVMVQPTQSQGRWVAIDAGGHLDAQFESSGRGPG